MRRWGWLVLCLWCMPAAAADIQYRLDNGDVTSVSDTPIQGTPQEPVVTIPEAASAIVWPVPTGQPASTSCGTGQPSWTRISDPDNVTVSGGGMALRTGLVLFKTTSTLLTGCHLVSSWKELRTLAENTIVTVVMENDFLLTTNALNVVAQVRCPGATGGATCDSVRSAMTTLNNSYPTAAAFNNFLTQVITLRQDAAALKSAQCSANPGGPFC